MDSRTHTMNLESFLNQAREYTINKPKIHIEGGAGTPLLLTGGKPAYIKRVDRVKEYESIDDGFNINWDQV